MFHDFHQKNIQYHSDLFWERVAQAWDDDVYGDEHDDLWGTVFGQDRNSFEIGFEDDGIVLLTKGYSWHWNFSNDLTLYEYFYRNVPDGVKSNMHDMANRKMTKKVIGNGQKDIVMDITRSITEEGPFFKQFSAKNDGIAGDNQTTAFFDSFSWGDDKQVYHETERYVIRHATGDELAKQGGGKYSTKKHIEGFTDVYRYNERYDKDETDAPEKRTDIESTRKPLAEPVPGSILASDGQFYNSIDKVKANKLTPMGIVMAWFFMDGNIEMDSQYHGIVMGLTDIDPCKLMEASDEPCDFIHSKRMAFTTFDGIANTKTMQEGCGDLHHVHPAALACRDYAPELTKDVREEKGFSDWFLPCMGQWITSMDHVGLEWKYYDGSYFKLKNIGQQSGMQMLRKMFEEAGAGEYVPNGNYWTSSFYGQTNDWASLIFDESKPYAEKDISIVMKSTDPTTKLKVRPMLAFKTARPHI